jgi:hypothetical protein
MTLLSSKKDASRIMTPFHQNLSDEEYEYMLFWQDSTNTNKESNSIFTYATLFTYCLTCSKTEQP